MISFKQFLKESQNKETIAIVGGAMKPPHAGHFDMVQKYLKKADKVIVLISNPKSTKSERKTKTGKTITPEMSEKIWRIFLDRYNLNNKVEVKISPFPSPITAAFDYVENDLKNKNIIFGVSRKGDDWKRYSTAQEYFKNIDRTDITVLDPYENAVEPFELNGQPVSATTVRQNIDNPKMIKQYFPKKLTDGDLREIMEILK